jgi:hypothetical protein
MSWGTNGEKLRTDLTIQLASVRAAVYSMRAVVEDLKHEEKKEALLSRISALDSEIMYIERILNR